MTTLNGAFDLKIAVISKNKTRMGEIREILQGENPSQQVFLVEGGIDHLVLVADREHPDLIILDGLCHGMEEQKALGQLNLHYPDMAIIMLCENLSSEFLINAMRVGVREVLSLPLSKPALLEAVSRVQHRTTLGNAPPRKGLVLAFIACKGGSGATFLAANLGYILAAAKGKKVALLDLNLQFGDASLFVSDHVPVNTLSDVAGSNISRLDAYFLATSMVQVLPNFGVLAAPEDPSRAAEVKPEHIDVLLNLAKTHYDFVIMDIGRNLNATTVKALDHAEMILPVLQETLPFIRDAKRLIHSLQALGYTKEKIHLIVNRYEKGGDIRLEDVERTLEAKVFKTIPNSFAAVTASVNQGVPIMQIASSDPVTKALQEVAQELAGGSEGKKGGWLSRFRRSA
jgi:pilus assembly protein CpaE